MRRYLIFITAGIGLLMYAIDSTVVAVAFPNIIRDFNTNLIWTAWTISIYYIALTMSMPLMGNLSDTFGRKKVFLLSLALFTLSSVACGLSPNIHTLIVCRFLQGVGGASFLPTASGMVSDIFPDNRERAIGLFTSIFPIGGIIGPNLGGWIVAHYSWRYIFYINLPIGIVLAALIAVLLKDSKASHRQRIDVAGAALLSSSILCLMFAFNLIGESLSLPSTFCAAALLAVSLSLFAFFLRHEKQAPTPIIDLALLKSKPFLAANMLNMILGAGLFGVFAFLPLFVTSVYNLSTLMSGVILTPRSLGTIPAAAITAFLLTRWGYRRPMVLGLTLIGLATVLLGEGVGIGKSIGLTWGAPEILSVLIFFTGLGMGIALPATNNAVIELMPERVATITGLRGMFRTIGGAFGISLITFILQFSPSKAIGFRLTFILFGVGLLCAIPLVFLMPSGKKGSTGRKYPVASDTEGAIL